MQVKKKLLNSDDFAHVQNKIMIYLGVNEIENA